MGTSPLIRRLEAKGEEMLLAILPMLLQQLGREPAITVEYLDTESDEAANFDRFLQRMGERAWDSLGGGRVVIFIACSKSRYAAIATQYRSEFGVDVGNTVPEALSRLYTQFHLVPRSPQQWVDFSKEFDPSIGLGPAYDAALLRGDLHKDQPIVRCDYMLRPWIDERMKTTVRVQGTFIVKDGQGERKVRFWFPE